MRNSTSNTTPADPFRHGFSMLIKSHFDVTPADASKLSVVEREVVELLGRHGIFARDASPPPDEEDTARREQRFRIIRVEDEFFTPKKLDQRDTLCRACCGRQASNLAFRVVSKAIMTFFMTTCFASGCLLGILGIIGAIPTGWSLGVILTVPGQLCNFGLMSRPLVIKLFGEFETWYLLFLNVVFLLCLCDIVKVDPPRVFAAAMILWNNTCIILGDAQFMSSKARIVHVIGYTVGFLSYLALFLAFQLGAASDVQARKVSISPAGIDITLDVLLFANNRLLTICLFYVKNIFLRLRHGDAYVVLRARLESGKTTQSDLQQKFDRTRRASTLEQFSGNEASLVSAAIRRASRGKVIPRLDGGASATAVAEEKSGLPGGEAKEIVY